MTMGVVNYYTNKSILITGASGFLGKILVEKLLRCCPEIRVIYLMMRMKKGHSPQERLNEVIRLKCFEKIKNSDVLSKLCVIHGDMLLEDLGMSVQDRCLLQKEVQIVFHSAASVRFDMNLRDAINTNVTGTKRVLDLAEGIENLEVFVHVSTSYCHDALEVLEEKVYPPRHRPQEIIDFVQWMDDDILLNMQPKLIKPFVNTYGYSKNLSEGLVAQYKEKFTIAIARPSIVVASCKEPLPGWVDNINGPTGAHYAGASGVLHSSYCKGDYGDIIPADVVVNGCILLAYTTGIERPNDIRVCNVTDSGVNNLNWNTLTSIMTQHVLEYPLTRCLYYPAGSTKKCYYHHKIAEFFFHTLPAYFIDLLLYLFGQKTFMVKIEKRIRNGMQLMEYYYSTKIWDFRNDYFRSLKNQITEEENDIFYTDISKIDYVQFLKDYHLGVRHFIAKDDPSTIPQARRHMKRLYYLHMTLKTLFYISLAYIAVCLFVKYIF